MNAPDSDEKPKGLKPVAESAMLYDDDGEGEEEEYDDERENET
jgi:hypothetical protein